MTMRYQGAVVRTDGAITDANRRALAMLILVSHVETVETFEGPALLVVFDRDIRSDDFEDGVGGALAGLRFVAKVEPLPSNLLLYSHSVQEQVGKLADYAVAMKPQPSNDMTLEEIGAHAVRMRAWGVAQDAIHETIKRLTSPKRTG